jgi:phosphatidylglycerophosphatase A
MNEKMTLKKLLANPIHFFAFGFGSGLSPVAPGTFGTLMAVPFWLFGFAYLSPLVYLLFLLLVVVVGIWLCDETARDMGVHDHPGIVWDEFAGYFLTMLPYTLLTPQMVGVGSLGHMTVWALVGFAVFRVFDILKPSPVKQVDQHVHGGLGIMLDDLVAGVYAFVVMMVVYSLWSAF